MYKNYTRILIAMKIIILLLTVTFIHVSAAGLAQKVTLRQENTPLREIFNELNRQTGYNFVWSSDHVENDRQVSVHVDDEPLDFVLQVILKNSPFTYFVEGKTIIIKEKKAISSSQPSVGPPQQGFKITGVIHDRAAREGLIGVNIRINGSKQRSITDSKGNFILANVTENAIIHISMVGYEPFDMGIRKLSGDIYTAYAINKNKANNLGVNSNINGGLFVDIALEPSNAVLDEAVITTGYGNFKRGNYTGAATTIKADDIMMAGVSSVDQMLEGIVPGMYVNTPTGQVGAASKIRVRGTSTLLGSQEPVWVVDGVIQTNPNSYENTSFSTNADDIRELAGSAISWLNPFDIETITVLKDASATAIYGSKAANGVIVITTKKAVAGKVTINYSGDMTVGQRPGYGLYNQMNSAELMQYNREIYDDRAPYQPGIIHQGFPGLIYQMLNHEITLDEMNTAYHQMANQNTDYFKALFRNAFSNTHSLSISGGSDLVQNRMSFSYDNQLGEAKGNNLKTFGGSSNTTLRLTKKLTVDLNLNGTYRKVDGFAYGVDPFNYAYNTARIYPLYNADGSYFYYAKPGDVSTAVFDLSHYNYNILNEEENTGSGNKTWSWNTSTYASWKILPYLEYQGTFSFAGYSARTDQWATELSYYITNMRGYEYGSVAPSGPEIGASQLPSGGKYEYATNTTNTILGRNALVFNKLIHDVHELTVQLGFEARSSKVNEFSELRYGYLKYRGNTFASPPLSYTPVGNSSNSSPGPVTNQDIAIGNTLLKGATNNYLSEFGQLTYTYDSRYIFSASANQDASNRFGQFNNKKFAPTWSVGGRWRIGNEKVIKESLQWLDAFELYGSYGYQGQAVESISPYLTATDIGSLLGYNVYGFAVDKLPYPDLGWQKTSSWNLGLDMAFLGGKIVFNGNLYKKVSNVYNDQPIPFENGAATDVVSGTKMNNSGYELSLQGTLIQHKDFTWIVGVNSAVNHNKILNTGHQDTYQDIVNGKGNVPGVPYSSMYSFNYTGLDPNGRPLFDHIDDNVPGGGYASALDYLVRTGKFIPDLSGGINTTLRYKGFSANALFSYQFGANGRLPQVYDYINLAGTPDPMQNVNRDLFNRWRVPGDESVPGIFPSVPGIGNVDNQVDLTNVSNTNEGGSRYRSRYELYAYSDARVASTDMIRCRSLSLGYEFGQRLLQRSFIKRLSIKASMTNPFMWASDERWKGIDPSTGDWPARRTTSLTLQMSL